MPSTRVLAAIAIAATSFLVAATCLTAQLRPPGEEEPELLLVTGEVVEIDVKNGVIVVHVEAIDDLDVEHFDLEVRIHEETLFENESGLTIERAEDLRGTLVDVEGFVDADVFIAEVIWVIEGRAEEEMPEAAVT